MKPSSSPTSSSDLIPGLPNEVAELCLLHLPFHHLPLARSVCATWHQTLTHPSFLHSKLSLSLSLPYLFVFAFHPSTRRLQWLALDPPCRRCLLLPPMPSDGVGICAPSFAVAADRERGEIYVIGGMREDAERGGEAVGEVAVYSAASNSWRVGKGMRVGRAFFAAAAIGGRVFVAGGGDGWMREVERYDPVEDRWDDVAGMSCGMAR